MSRFIAATLFLVAAGACGGEDAPPSFVVQVNSMGVVPTAVNRVVLVLAPADLDRRFQMVPDGTHAGGEIFTRVSAAGEYVITIEQGYFDDHFTRPMTPGVVFTLDVPLQGAQQDDPSIRDPILTATFVRGSETIARGERFLEWPLPQGERAIVTVGCILPDFRLQCTNNDGVDSGPPAPADGGSDAGPPPPDGG